MAWCESSGIFIFEHELVLFVPVFKNPFKGLGPCDVMLMIPLLQIDSDRAVDLPAHLIECIAACITTPKFSVSINGGLEGYFSGGKGLRQGDFPLSVCSCYGSLFQDPCQSF